MKKFFSLFAALLFAGSMMATEATYTFTDVATPEDAAADGFTVTFNKNNGSTAPAWNANNSEARLYAKGSLVITGTVTIKSIVFDYVINKNSKGKVPTIDGVSGTTNAGTWDAESKTWSDTTGDTEITFATSGDAGNIGFKSLTITYESGEAPAVEKPTIAGDAKFLTEVEVSISAEDGASIYYTIDGTEPTAASTPYAAPFTLTESATVKAIAKVGDNVSAVASKAFVKIPVVTCAEANALAKDAEACLNEVTVVYVNGANIYVKDESGSTLVYAFNFGLVAGDVVSGIIGVASPYNGLPELKPSVTLADLTVNHGEAPAPEVFAAAPVAADVNKYIIMKGVEVATGEFTTASATNLNLTIGEETVVLRNAFKLAASFDATKKYDVVGAVAIYNSNVQVYFINATESTATALENTAIETKAVKIVRDGQLLILKGNKTFNAQGAIVR